MKIKEQVLSREQMAHLKKLGVDTSDASMYWIVTDKIEKEENDSDAYPHYNLSLSVPTMIPAHLKITAIPTYTIGDLIEKLPKHFYIKEAQISMVAINGSGAFQVWYDKVPKSCKSDGTIKNALYKLLCWVAENHKELLEVKK